MVTKMVDYFENRTGVYSFFVKTVKPLKGTGFILNDLYCFYLEISSVLISRKMFYLWFREYLKSDSSLSEVKLVRLSVGLAITNASFVKYSSSAK